MGISITITADNFQLLKLEIEQLSSVLTKQEITSIKPIKVSPRLKEEILRIKEEVEQSDNEFQSTPQEDFGAFNSDLSSLATQTHDSTELKVPETKFKKPNKIIINVEDVEELPPVVEEKPKEYTVEDVRKAATELLNRRRQHNNDGILKLQSILPKFGVARASDLDPSKFGDFISEVGKY